jgi:aminoglycoside 6-adenylyltransferase
MRTEAQMLDLILGFARRDERIRVVAMNGSRVNSKIPKDIFQDYDVVYYVDDLTPFIHDLSLIEYFGAPMIVQFPDEMDDPPPVPRKHYAYLMQFTDGVRIDLSFHLLDDLDDFLRSDTLTVVLLDKDGRAAQLPPPSDEDYFPTPPTEKQFDDCCNEFWWLNPYVAKGLWRGELIAPKYLLDGLMRSELLKMLNWFFGMQTGFNQSPGKLGRFYPEVLGESLWRELQQTYTGHQIEEIWSALFAMGSLFRQAAQQVALQFGFRYPDDEDARVSTFIRKVQRMPDDAVSFDLT